MADRLWAAVMLTTHVTVCESILLGRPVLARRLDWRVLQRGLRGEPLPQPGAYLVITGGMLDAIDEGGPL